MPRCALCPVRAGLPCLGERHAPACRQVAEGQPGRAEQLVAMAEGRPFVGVAPAIRAHSPPPRPPGDPRVRVGVLSPCCNLGGADLWVADLMAAVDPARVSWTGTACRDDTGIAINPHVRALWEAHGPLGVGYPAIAELADRSDLVVAWGAFHSWGFPAGRLSALVGSCPLLVASHGPQGECLTDPGGRFPRLSAAACSRPALRGLPPGLREGARVILNAIDPARVAPTRPAAETRRLLGIPEGAKVAGFLARMAPEKRPATFLDALALLPEGWVGVLAGGGIGSEEARAHGGRVAPGRATWLGERLDVGDVLAAFDVLAMPSASEACSLAAGEAWLAGVPLVSTRTGLLEDRPELARLVPNPPTGRDLADAILADAADPIGTAARVDRARAFAVADLSLDRFGREWTDAIVRAAADPYRLAMLAETCPHGSGPCGCGSGPPRSCSRPDRPALVRRADCLACVAGSAGE